MLSSIKIWKLLGGRNLLGLTPQRKFDNGHDDILFTIYDQIFTTQTWMIFHAISLLVASWFAHPAAASAATT